MANSPDYNLNKPYAEGKTDIGNTGNVEESSN